MKLMLGLLLVLGARAQEFDAASVKFAGPWVTGHRTLTVDAGRITFTHATLGILLTRAYDVWSDQIRGPQWLDDLNTTYTVTATMPPGTSKEQWRRMLQNLLAERFHLRLHHEQETRPGYELVIAQRGHKLSSSTATDAAEPPPVLYTYPTSGAGSIHVKTRNTTAAFCRILSVAINSSNGVPIGPQARIVDHTGLDGFYDFHLEFNGLISPHPSSEALDQLASYPGPTIFTALETQLGLKLRRLKGVTVDVLVVDSTDKLPAEN